MTVVFKNVISRQSAFMINLSLLEFTNNYHKKVGKPFYENIFEVKNTRDIYCSFTREFSDVSQLPALHGYGTCCQSI